MHQNFSTEHPTASQFWTLLAVFIVVRILFAALLWHVTGGREVSSDIKYLTMILDNPLGSLTGSARFEVASYPPLMSFFVFPLMQINLQWADEFIAWRASFLAIELLNFLLFWRILAAYWGRAQEQKQLSHHRTAPPAWIGLLFVIAPFQLLSSVVFVQDELISQLFVMLTVYALVKGHRLGAILTLSIGILAGKVFFIIPLFYVFWFYRFRVDWRDFLAVTPFVLIYGWSVLAAIASNGNIPFDGFSPSAKYASTFWVLGIKHFGMNSDSLKPLSLALSMAAQLALIIYALSNWRKLSSTDGAILLVGTSIASFFLTFYQHNPEYILLLAPIVLLFCQSVRALLLSIAVLSLSWLPNIFYGLNNVLTHKGSASEARRAIMGDWLTLLNIDFSMAHSASIALYSALYAGLVIYLIKCLTVAAAHAPGKH